MNVCYNTVTYRDVVYFLLIIKLLSPVLRHNTIAL